MEVRKAFIENKTMEVMSEKEYFRRAEFTDPMFEDACVEQGGTLYPIMSRYDPTITGVYDAGVCLKYNKPPEELSTKYSADHIIDFDKATDYGDVIRMKDSLNRAEVARLTTKDNVYVPNIQETDSPLLKVIKEAVGAKEIDLDSYRQRAGTNFSNWTRLITSPKNDSITIKKAVNICEMCDLELSISVKDKKDAINPVGHVITTVITTEE